MTKSSILSADLQDNYDEEESHLSFASVYLGFGQLSPVQDRPLQISKSLSRSSLDVIKSVPKIVSCVHIFSN